MMTPRRWHRGSAPAILLAASLVTASAAPTPVQQDAARVNRDAQLVADFVRRTQAYAELHRKLEQTLPARPEHATPAQVETHQRALDRLLIQARPRAQQGDLFTSDIRAYFRRQIARALAGPDGRAVKDEIMDENPGRIQLRINGRYPDDIPVSTMPPQILAVFPSLPDELEYRFIGRRLILLDVHAHLVLDYVDDALPR
ncbi:MAG: hypothetical protein ACRD1U_17125 [Vicinamibacterales bacterium]